MQIQISTDKNIEVHEDLTSRVEATINKTLRHLIPHITRLEVHLSDEDGDKRGQNDKRCKMEARLEGRQPTAVTCDAATLAQAVAGAVNRLQSTLQHTLDQRHRHR